MVFKHCKRCGEPLGDVHKNKQFCVKCSTERRRDQNREAQRRRRVREKNHGVITRAVTEDPTLNTPQQIAYLTQLGEFGALFESIWNRLFKTMVLPLHFETQNRIARLEHKISLATGGKVKAQEWWAYAVETARRLIDNYPKHPLFQIRQEIEDIFAIDKPMAEKIVREARNQLQLSQFILAKQQKTLTDWTEVLR